MMQWKVVRTGVAPIPLLQPLGKPPARPEASGDLLGQRKSFEASLALHGENFAEAFSRNDKALSEPLSLTLAAGFGCGVPLPLSSSSPTTLAQYVGQGDVLTVQGRSVTCLSGADRLSTRQWSQYSPLGGSAHSHSHVPGSAYATGSDISTLALPLLPKVGEEIGALAVSPCRRYLALASRFPRPVNTTTSSGPGPCVPGATTTLRIFAAATGTTLATLSRLVC